MNENTLQKWISITKDNARISVAKSPKIESTRKLKVIQALAFKQPL